MIDHRLYKHVKTGKFYIVLNDNVYIEKTGERAVCYYRLQPKTDGEHKVWIRPYDEFHDGRFKKSNLKEDA